MRLPSKSGVVEHGVRPAAVDPEAEKHGIRGIMETKTG
jgi:hypothetical protein